MGDLADVGHAPSFLFSCWVLTALLPPRSLSSRPFITMTTRSYILLWCQTLRKSLDPKSLQSFALCSWPGNMGSVASDTTYSNVVKSSLSFYGHRRKENLKSRHFSSTLMEASHGLQKSMKTSVLGFRCLLVASLRYGQSIYPQRFHMVDR